MFYEAQDTINQLVFELNLGQLLPQLLDGNVPKAALANWTEIAALHLHGILVLLEVLLGYEVSSLKIHKYIPYFLHFRTKLDPECAEECQIVILLVFQLIGQVFDYLLDVGVGLESHSVRKVLLEAEDADPLHLPGETAFVELRIWLLEDLL